MSKTVTATEAKNKLGSIMAWVVNNQDEVIIENRGNPHVVLVPYDEYDKLKGLREQVRRAEAWARLQQVAQEVQGKNRDLTSEEADELADRFVREVINDIVGGYASPS
jgi:prevent-host-death family protein